MGFNPIGDDGARALWECVAGATPGALALHSLDLCKCEVTDTGALLLLEATASASSPLRRVDLSYNAVSEAVMQRFLKKKLLWVNLASGIEQQQGSGIRDLALAEVQ